MADALVADLAAGLIRKLVSLATQEVIQAWNLHEDLDELRERLETIYSLQSEADTKKLMPAVQNWFNKLEDVTHFTSVFMDELAYEVTRRKVENRHKVLDFFTPSKNTILYHFKVARKIKSIQASFDKYFKRAGDLGLQPLALLCSVVQPREIRYTPPFEDESKIVGRVNDISYLVHALCTNFEENLAVIAVVGMGGQGKTTLARMVYNKDVVIDMFPMRMWVTVSDDFDFMKILNDMVVSLTSNNSMLKNSDGLIKDLQKHLNGVKFLLILDDVWNDEQEKWGNLMNSLLGVGSAKGSKILVTTRNQEVVDAMHCTVTYRVEKLSDEDSWALFKQRAFSHGGVLETDAFATLGRRMVSMCGGLPLAIKTLGGLLHVKKSEEEWLHIQNSEVWKSKGVLSSLRLSYDNLPNSSLKRCFLYCSILPKDSKIFKDELIHSWMSLGFLLPPTDSNMLMEDVGNEYFNILLWNSLLQDVERDKFGNITNCKMHDLVHDLALDLSKRHSVIVNMDHESNHMFKPIYIRINEGISVVKLNILKRNFERVQVLYAGTHILNDVLPYLKNLTTLVLRQNCEVELPNSMSNMKYLKFLDISTFDRSYRLPNYITRLYNLQTLRATFLKEIPRNFCNLINLRHFVIRNVFFSTRFMFTEIERLTSLQTLPHFVVSRDQNCLIGQLGGLCNLRGNLTLHGLTDVENMEEASMAKLHEKPNIQCLRLDWSKNGYEMESHNQYERGNIEYNDEDVMEGLKPHSNLKYLTLEHFKGRKFSSWITMMTNLVKLKFGDCEKCEEFPPLGQLPKLKEMEIFRMNSIKVMGSGSGGIIGRSNYEFSGRGAANTVTTMYPLLTKLILCNLRKVEEWLEPEISTSCEDRSTVLAFPKLEVLEIYECPKLKMIPNSCFPSLKQLRICNLDISNIILETVRINARSLMALELTRIRDEGGNFTFSSLSNAEFVIDQLLKNNSQSLTSLKVCNCEGLTCLTLGVALEKLELRDCFDLSSITFLEDSCALTDLTIKGCSSLSQWLFDQSLSSKLVRLTLGPLSEELDEFPWPFPSSFPNLISLKLHGWEKVKSIMPEGHINDCLSSTFPALIILQIYSFPGVKALPDSLAKLPSLTTLCIKFCRNLESLPTFDESQKLKCLRILMCPLLEKRYRKERDTEWFKIQNISTCMPFRGGRMLT